MKRVLLAMSGGVDSSTAAIVLQEKGYEVVGVTMQLLGNDTDLKDVKNVAEQLKIEHHVVDLREDFKKDVVENFVESYKKGITPNPCVVCNKKIKFGKLYELAKKLKCDYYSTGHYAKVEYDEELSQYVIKKSKAKGKDQTYVLYGIDKQIIEHLIFPLADFENKDQIRSVASEHNLNVANKKDSQEICFIPDNDYVKFIGWEKEGNIVDKTGKVLGKHKGFLNYTIGQRKGLGISNETPLYVIGIDSNKNEVIVGSEEELYTTEVYAEDLNFLISVDTDIKAKIRYGAKEAPAQICLINEKQAKIVFEEPQRAVTPGQSIVFYKDDILAGGGVIITKEELK